MHPARAIGSVVRSIIVRWVRVLEVLFGARWRLGRPLPHPVSGTAPVVLVPGFANSAASMSEWERALRDDGFQVFSYDDHWQGLGDIPLAAASLGDFIDQVRLDTGADMVALVGYSLGGVIARWWVTMLGGAAHTDVLVTVGTPHQGTMGRRLHEVVQRGWFVGPLLYDSMPAARRQLVDGSEIMQRLAEHTDTDAVRIVSIYNPLGDGVIWPASSPALPGAVLRPVPTRGPRWLRRLIGNHFALAHWSSEAYHEIRDALRRDHVRP